MGDYFKLKTIKLLMNGILEGARNNIPEIFFELKIPEWIK
jgi:hypothetical protein